MLHITGKEKSQVGRNPKYFKSEVTCSKHILKKRQQIKLHTYPKPQPSIALANTTFPWSGEK